ncbi:cadherin-like domain-containing protein [Candidatus Sulfurimonas marisnigri]|uniref:Cadherin-like domain-containing protein n=1 Tax=Candidatus Sulfurimonas marisnigri TaxID=2740405 RepID=A0A7S7M2W4_9BACT|nr:VCBS domain-containing protein [Candidatus Sulfurimonas marisnigri]QOY55683.1 cadherin-like domain-containing protein [Candidatus Sulfurimonas marisnigri]
MSTGKVIGQIQVSLGNVKIVGVDGVIRNTTYDGLMYEGEQIVSGDPTALFQIKYAALPEATAYDGIFRVLADGSVIAGIDAMDSIASDENLMDLLETAAGEEGIDPSSAFIPIDVVADSSVQGFTRGSNSEVLGADGIGSGAEFSDDLNDFAPTALDAANVATEDDLTNVTGQLVGADADGNAFTFVLVDGPTEGTIILNPDGSYIYNVAGDFQDLGVGETRDVTFTYKTVETNTPEGYESELATVTITVTGTNDQPEITNIYANGEETWLIGASTIQSDNDSGEAGGYYDIDGASVEAINTLFYVGEGSVELSDIPNPVGDEYDPTDGAAMKFTMNVDAGETVTFNWTFNDAEGYDSNYEDDEGYRDFSFVVIDGQSIELLADTYFDGNTNSGVFTYTFENAGQHEITFGVMNDDDEQADSSLLISYISGGTIVSTDSVGYVESMDNTLYETHDNIDISGVDDTQDEVHNIFTGVLSVSDVDVTDTHTFEVVTGTVSIDGVIQPDALAIIYFNDESGNWEYKIEGDFNYLSANENAVVTFDYVAIDDSGVGLGDEFNEPERSEPATVTLTITGTNDQPIVSEVAVEAVNEALDGMNVNVFVNQLSVTDDDVNDTHTFHIVDPDANEGNFYGGGGTQGAHDPHIPTTVTDDSGVPLGITATVEMTDIDNGTFEIVGDFNALAVGESATVTFSYVAIDNSDGVGEASVSEPKLVTVTILGTNDQPVVTDINANTIVVGEELTDVHDIVENGEGTVAYTYFTVYETTTVSIAANSTGSSFVDPYLYVFSNDGDLTEDDYITHNDDSGPGYNSFLSVTLQPGEYIAAVGDFPLNISEAVNGINNGNNSAGEITIIFTADYGISIHDSNTNNSLFYESHDTTDIIGLDDTQEDVYTTFVGTLAVQDDDVTDTHTFEVVTGTIAINGETISDALATIYFNEELGNWEYEIRGDFNYLSANENAVVTFDYVAIDDSGVGLGDEFNEPERSEPATVTLTITGSNDQPIVSNVVLGIDEIIYETHDTNPADNYNGEGYNPDWDGGIGLNDEYSNALRGTLVASDDDINDTHMFDIINTNGGNFTSTLDTQAEGYNTHVEYPVWDIDLQDGELDFPVSVMIESTDIDASEIDLSYIRLYNNDGADSSTDFKLVGNFNALAAGETATVTFTYNATDSSSGSEEPNLSEPKTVTITVTGTNDQPVVENVVLGIDEIIYETHDTNPADNYNGEGYNPDWDGGIGLNDEYSNALRGTLVASDDDINDTHMFDIINTNGGNFTSTLDTQAEGYNTHVEYPVWDIDLQDGELDFPVSVMIESTDIDASEIDLSYIRLYNNDGADSSTDFKLVGNFNALAAGETATVTFTYNATDSSSGSEEPNLSEPKTVTITVTGTNDQPVIENVNLNDTQGTIYETRDNTTYFNNSDDTQNDTYSYIDGTLATADDDVNDGHTFILADITAREFYGVPRQGADTQDVKFQVVSEYADASDRVVDGYVKMVVESTDINVGHIDVKGIVLFDNDPTDATPNSTDFKVFGDFNALGVDETATITFKYYAQDDSGVNENGDVNNEPSLSEPKTVTFTVTGTNDQPIIDHIETRDVLETNLDSVTYYGEVAPVDLTDVASDPKEGSALKLVFDTADGDTVSFDWNFISADMFLDAVSVMVDGVIVGTVDTQRSLTSGTYETDPLSSGEHTITFVVVNDRLDDGNTAYNAQFVISNVVTDGVMLPGEVFGAVDRVGGTYTLSANSNLPVADLDAFIDLEGVTYENAHLSGSIEEYLNGEDRVDGIHVSDDDDNDGYSYVAFADRIVEFTETHDDPGTDVDLITTPIRVSLDADGNYDVISSSFDKLGDGDSVTITFDIRVRDDSGASDRGTDPDEAAVSEAKTVTIVINGTNDSPVLGAISAVEMMETDLQGLPFTQDQAYPENSYIIGTLPPVTELVSDEDLNDTHTYVEFGQFSGPPMFVNVLDANGAIMGNAQIRLDSAGEYRVFNPSFNNLAAGETATINFEVKVTDGTSLGENPESNAQVVTLTVTGTNDQPVVQDVHIGIAETSLANVGIYEEARYEGTLTSADEDTANTNPHYQLVGDVEVSGNSAGILASHVVVALSGASSNGWNTTGDYTVTSTMFNGLAAGETVTVSFDYKASDWEGFSTTGDGVNEASHSDVKTVTLTITGTNDAAVLSGDVAGGINEDSVLTIDGQLLITDEDVGEAHYQTGFDFDSSSDNSESYGTFTIDTNGRWTYSLDNANHGSEIQALHAGETITEVFNVYSQDDTTHSNPQLVTITIEGAEDGPVAVSETITKVADHVDMTSIPSYEDGDITAMTFNSLFPYWTNENAEVVVRGNGTYAVDDQNEVRIFWWSVADADKENFIDSKGLWNEGIIFNFNHIVSEATIVLHNIDNHDNVAIALYNGDDFIKFVDASNVAPNNQVLTIDEGLTFTGVRIYALDTINGITDFTVDSVVGYYEYETINPFIIEEETLLANDTDAENDDLDIIFVDSLLIPVGGGAAIGTVTLVDGDVLITPNSGVEFTDPVNEYATFNYTISDGNGGIDTATATINIRLGTLEEGEAYSDIENVLVIDDNGLLDLTNVTNIDVIQLGEDATLVGSGALDAINANDVFTATGDDNTLVITALDNNAADQVNVDTSSLTPQGDTNIGGVDYAQYGDGTSTLLIEIDPPIDMP